jgi:undecaprenyl-diphosphatase
MNWWQALVLGVVEGITEYLPVSSTGHLIVAQRMMGIGTDSETEKAAADCFAICIQGGAIAAVLGLYWPRVSQMFQGLLGRNKEGLHLIFAIIAGFLPAAVIGLIANDWIEEKLFHFKWIAWAWFVGGIGILAIDRWMKKGGGSKGVELAEITLKMALFVGFAQCIAMWPGTSRSLMTIIGGLLIGMRLSAAVEFSFLLGLVTLGAATAKKAVWPVEGLAENYDQVFGGAQLMWDTYGLVPLLIGVVAATVSAALAVKWMVGYLNRRGLGVFGWYRIAAAIVAAVMISTNFLNLGVA